MSREPPLRMMSTSTTSTGLSVSRTGPRARPLSDLTSETSHLLTSPSKTTVSIKSSAEVDPSDKTKPDHSNQYLASCYFSYKRQYKDGQVDNHWGLFGEKYRPVYCF